MLLYTDTDTLKTIIKTEDMYKDMNYHIKYIDSSNFDKNTDKPITPNKNRKVPLLLKDEYAEDPIITFVGSSSKAYTKKHTHDKNTTKARGVKSNVRHEYGLDIFKKVVETTEPNKVTQRSFQSRDLELFFKEISKTGLPTSYRKRQVFMVLNLIFPWGYKGTKYKQLHDIFSDDKISNETFRELERKTHTTILIKKK